MSTSFWLKITVTTAAALAGALINQFPVSLFFGANFVLGGVVAQAPTFLFGPVWGVLAMGVATLPTLAYWRDPFFPFLMALAALTMGFWLRRHRSWVVEGALVCGVLIVAPVALLVYLRSWTLPTAGVVVITAKVIFNFMADVVTCSLLLRLTGLEARLHPRTDDNWDMRAHLAHGLSFVVFLCIGGTAVFFGNTEYRALQSRAAAEARHTTEVVRDHLTRSVTDHQRALEAVAVTIAGDQDPRHWEPSLVLFQIIHPEAIRMAVTAADGRALFSRPDPPPAADPRPTLRLTAPTGGTTGAPQAVLTVDMDPAALAAPAIDSGHGRILVLDQAGQVVTGPAHWPPGTVWQPTDLGQPQPEFQGVVPVLPDTGQNTLVQWQDGHLVYTAPEPGSGWQVTGLLPLGPYQNQLFFAYALILWAGLGLLIIVIPAIHWISRRLTRPLEAVAATARARLVGDGLVEWPPDNRIAEVNVLVSHLRAVENALAAARTELVSRNQALEEANRSLERLAAFDDLTGLRNRRTLDTVLDQELKRARRSERSGAVLLIDLDNFKDINDTFGHPSGDAVLRTVTEIIASCARESDLVARYGGDEVTTVLFDTNPAGALEVAERIRSTVQASTVKVPGGKAHLTVSTGVAMYPEHGVTLAGIFAAADRALYASKKAGRNRVSMYRPDVARPVPPAG